MRVQKLHMLTIVRRKTSKIVSAILFLGLCALFTYVVPVVVGSGVTTPVIRCAIDKANKQSCACPANPGSQPSGALKRSAAQDRRFHIFKGEMKLYRAHIASLNAVQVDECSYPVTYRLFL